MNIWCFSRFLLPLQPISTIYSKYEKIFLYMFMDADGHHGLGSSC